MEAIPAIIGGKYNCLTILSETDRNKFNQRQVIVQCICGKILVVLFHGIRYGHTKSCGCFQKKRASEAKKKHGLTNHHLYDIWSGVKRRCYNKNDTGYPKYGAIGIKMCDEWKNNFMSFYNWAIVSGYRPELSIDRHPNQKGNYEPGNCRWATSSQQARNTKRNYLITYKGETKCLTEWAETIGMERGTLKGRLQKYGWSIERAFTTPVIQIKGCAATSLLRANLKKERLWTEMAAEQLKRSG